MASARSDLKKMDWSSTDLGETAGYKRLLKRKDGIGLVLLLMLALACLASIRTGSLPLADTEVLKTLLSWSQDGRIGHVVWNIRLPRTIAALLAGAGLGMAGAVMQNILKNPLASPFTIGVSQGAAFGAAFAIIILGAGETHRAGTEQVTITSPHLVVVSAFAGSLLAVAFILILASLKNVAPEAVILAGVALSAFFGAGTMLLQYFGDNIQVAATVFWTFGDLGKAGWLQNGIILVAVLLSTIFFIINRWNCNALAWGDDVARSLGVRVRRLRIGAMVFAALTVAVITSFLGIIGFIGLMAPHLMRLLLGNDYRYLIPTSAVFGALLLLVSDIIARTIMAPVILPVGIITSFAGAPLFLYLLVSRK
jgi:iron complex transport system permease protein